ncbi:hypothetical protein B0H15DRAFT_855925 [Mycena belliarum]|uniref:Uncharacterized protein n=1 Tax=Mycena belliarum TaxID=1033014 RepID=A0AAD6XM47_9AGAR|nr:hypothetical protein B0H15DRAFT_855925 [Mycena belliae]
MAECPADFAAEAPLLSARGSGRGPEQEVAGELRTRSRRIARDSSGSVRRHLVEHRAAPLTALQRFGRGPWRAAASSRRVAQCTALERPSTSLRLRLVETRADSVAALLVSEIGVWTRTAAGCELRVASGARADMRRERGARSASGGTWDVRPQPRLCSWSRESGRRQASRIEWALESLSASVRRAAWSTTALTLSQLFQESGSAEWRARSLGTRDVCRRRYVALPVAGSGPQRAGNGERGLVCDLRGGCGTRGAGSALRRTWGAG